MDAGGQKPVGSQREVVGVWAEKSEKPRLSSLQTDSDAWELGVDGPGFHFFPFPHNSALVGL